MQASSPSITTKASLYGFPVLKWARWRASSRRCSLLRSHEPSRSATRTWRRRRACGTRTSGGGATTGCRGTPTRRGSSSTSSGRTRSSSTPSTIRRVPTSSGSTGSPTWRTRTSEAGPLAPTCTVSGDEDDTARVKNSWGERGYIRMRCGIATEASYPIKTSANLSRMNFEGKYHVIHTLGRY